ncbi:hypothetical protein GCM10027064_23890 [Microbacterium petrolearium]
MLGNRGEMGVPAMSQTKDDPTAATRAMAQLSNDLQALRMRAGDISYGEIAARITRMREEKGIAPASAHIARSTVYDAFRPERRRLNPSLVAEIVAALGGDASEAERWRERCIAARTAERPPVEIAEQPAPAAPAAPAARPAGRRWPTLPPPRPELPLAAALFVACIGVNLVGGVIVANFDLPIWLDMAGTAIIAVCIGPWAAVALAAVTLVLTPGTLLPLAAEGLPFGLVSVVGALVWGYGVHQWGLGRTASRFLVLNLLAAVSCTLTSLPITVLQYDGRTNHLVTTTLFERLHAAGANAWEAALVSNIGSSVADKLISGGIALLVALLLSRHADAAGRSLTSLDGLPGRD